MTTQPTNQRAGAILGLAAAALFGVSAPVAKVLLGGIPPLLLAGLLYVGAAAGLWAHRLVRPPTTEAGLVRADVPKLAGLVVSGGLVGPVLMLLGLSRVSALTGSLLLNLEAPFTMLLAVALFREHLGRHALVASMFILAGAVVLNLSPGELGVNAGGVLLLAGACAAWALDNNLTQRLTLKDPFAIVRVKTLVAGTVNTTLGLMASHGARPDARLVAGALLLGSLSYGLSVVLDAYALRFVGAAREAAYFATAPFVGALTSVVVLGEPLGALDLVAMGCMALGAALLVRERHGHTHRHDPMEHEHQHVHDEHHRHDHGPLDPPGEPHAHPHRHATLVHDHPHVPDAHHRHRH
ncbi:MAG TPA: EamA family transporter [Polyangiaceae bacterium]|jgi:drug/metabolite transporter (DMT)-like permease|nr:EamA family transporter [Polyangiaceae bacterium]